MRLILLTLMTAFFLGCAEENAPLRGASCDPSSASQIGGALDFVQCAQSFYWFADGPYHFGLDDYGRIKQADHLLFHDSACNSVAGQIHDYPLRFLQGDIYVFDHRGTLYEYVLGQMTDMTDLYIEDEFGNCSFHGSEKDVMHVVLHTGPVQFFY